MERAPQQGRVAAVPLRALVLAVALAVALTAPGTGVARAAACKSSLTVTSASGDAGQRGSLPNLLARACAGATIGFTRNTVVALSGPLTIGKPLTLQGGGIDGGELLVQSSNVTLDHMKLDNTPVEIGPSGVAAGKHLQDVSIVGSSLQISGKSSGEAVSGRDTDNLAIGKQGAGDTFKTAGRLALRLIGNGPVTVVANSFHSSPGIAINEAGSADLTLEHNSSNADFHVEPLQGTIESNTIREAGAKSGASAASKSSHGGVGLVVEGISHAQSGQVVVKGNTITNAGIEVLRENVEVASNKITGGATGLQVSCGFTVGPIMIVGNTLTQTTPGLRYTCTSSTPAATIKGNTLTNNVTQGMVLTTHAATVSYNNVTGSGTKGSPSNQPAPGILVDAPGGAGLALTSNHTDTNTGDGVSVAMNAVAAVSGGESYMNGQAGVWGATNARVSVSRVSFLHNGGPGIDLAPRGVTPNDQTKTANENIAWPVTSWSQITNQISGTTCAGCLVQAFTREPPPWTGSPDNGAGQSFVSSVVADASGNFTLPTPVMSCTSALNYTFTASDPASAVGPLQTRLVRVTSEFSSPPTCPSGLCPTGATSCCPTGSTSCCPDGTGTGCCPPTSMMCCASGTTGCCQTGTAGCCQTGTTCCVTGSASCSQAAPLGSCPSAGNCTFTLGSTLSDTANAAIESQQDTAIWGLTYGSSASGLSGTVLAKGTVPYTGQITEVMIKGIAMPNPASGAPAPLTQVHIQDLRPQGNGNLQAINSSQAFNLPDSGDPQQITTFMPMDLCVQAGDYVAFNDEGGFDPTWYPNGVPFQIFSSVGGPSFAYFAQQNGTGNGATFPLIGTTETYVTTPPANPFAASPIPPQESTPVYGQELLMQYVLATGPAESALCPGNPSYSAANG